MISAVPPFRLKEISSVDTSITQLWLSNKRSVPLIYTFSRYRKAEKQKKKIATLTSTIHPATLEDGGILAIIC